MTPQLLLQLCLVLHISAFTAMAGTVFANSIISRKLNKYLAQDKQKAISVLDSVSALPVVIGISALLIILSGVGMVSVLREAVTDMAWFRIKMALVLLILINGIAIAGPTGRKLRKLLTENDTDIKITAAKNKFRVFYITELLLFLAVFVLSVFRF